MVLRLNLDKVDEASQDMFPDKMKVYINVFRTFIACVIACKLYSRFTITENNT